MNEVEERLAAEIYQALMDHSNRSLRSRQAQDFKVGISDIGYCAERTRRMLDHQVPDATDTLAAFIGTAVGDLAEDAVVEHLWPHAIKQAEVVLRVQGADRAYEIPGHPDIIDPTWGVWDGKTDFGLSTIERDGPSFQQLFQRNAYALAAWEEGYFGDMALDEVMVGNWWVDRGAVDHRLVVDAKPFDPEIIQQGIEWLDGVVYAYVNQEEALKEPPRQVCKVTCGFWRECRAWETDVSGLIDDPVLVGSIESYAYGMDLNRKGARLQAEAKAHLQGISGSTGRHTLRWTWVNETETRRGYYKINLAEVEGMSNG